MMTDKEKRIALARAAIEGSGAAGVAIEGLRNLAAQHGRVAEEIFGRLDTLMDLWIAGTAAAWADLFSTEQIEDVIAWNATPTATAMREKQTTVQALGAQVMGQAIEQNTAGKS